MTTDTADESPQLSKLVASLVPCSRSKAEQYIEQGWVRVDGALAEEPQVRIAPGQRVEVDPQARLQPPMPATYLCNKPAGVAELAIDAASRWSGDTSGIRHVKAHRTGLRALLALPAQASGLGVCSQDGRIVRKLTEDAALLEQELNVDVGGTIAPDGLARLARGGAARVSWQSEARLRFAMKGIAVEAIPALCAEVGLTVTGIRRIRIGRVAMAGLPPGQWRYLRPDERF